MAHPVTASLARIVASLGTEAHQSVDPLVLLEGPRPRPDPRRGVNGRGAGWLRRH